MSDLITTANDKSVELQVRSFTAVKRMAHSAAERMKDEEGQTAAEYLGILLLVAAIILAITKLGIDSKIAGGVQKAVDSITGGGGGGGTKKAG